MQADADDLLHFASEPPNVVNALNRELWLRDDGTVEARPHDPATGMRHVLNVSYLPEATCPEYEAAVQSIFEKAEYPRTLIAFFDELMGYAIQLRRDIALIVLMTGGGNNGKTSLVRVLIELVGPDFVHSGRVDDLDGRFAVGSLFGKLLFVDDDVKAGAKLPDGALKKISEAKRLTGEHKFKPPFSFVNRSFPIMLFNNPPSLADLSLRDDAPPSRRPVRPHLCGDRDGQASLRQDHPERAFGGAESRLGGLEAAEATQEIPAVNRHAARATRPSGAREPAQGIHRRMLRGRPQGQGGAQTFYVAYRDWATRSGYSMTQVKSTVKKNLVHQGHPIKRHGEGLVVIGLKLRQL